MRTVRWGAVGITEFIQTHYELMGLKFRRIQGSSPV